MKMPEVYLVGELRLKNFEIFRLMHLKEDGWNYVKGFIIIEDCNRKTRLDDYPFLLKVYTDPNEFEGGENLLRIKAIVFEKLKENECEIIEHLSESLVEFKQCVDTIFSIELEPNLENLLDKLEEKPFEVYNELLQRFTEQKPCVLNYSEDLLKRLYQE